MFVSGVTSHFLMCLIIIHWVGSLPAGMGLWVPWSFVSVESDVLCLLRAALKATLTETLLQVLLLKRTVPAALRRAAECRRCAAASQGEGR